MNWKVLWCWLFFCLLLPNLGEGVGAQTRKKRNRVKKTGGSIATVNRHPELPEFAQSPLPKGNYAFVVPRCSEDRQVLVFNIYRENLFSQRMIVIDGQIKLMSENGSLIGDLTKAENNADVYLLTKLGETLHPTFLELYPGKSRMLSTIVLTKPQFTSDEMYQAYDLVKNHITFLGFSVGFASECNNLFLPDKATPVPTPQ